jgi:multiple sugar transport system substrate-binding protein
MNRIATIRALAIALCVLGMLVSAPGQAAEQKLTVWSHFADHQGVREFFREAEAMFAKENPGATLDITFYEKQALFAAETTALPAGEGPDVIYLEPDRMQFVDNGFVRPIDDLVDLNRLEGFAKEAWTKDGKVYGLGMQAFTVELYYDKNLMAKVLAKTGAKLEPDFQLTQAEFLDMVKKASEMGITAVVQGIGDRPYPGSYLLHELLLRKLGRADYANLWAGKLSFKDPRIVEVFDYMKQVIDAGAYPKTFTTMKLGESHYYFHTKPGGLTFPLGSWYSSRAFNPTDKGGQPKDFALGVMQFPAMDGGACNDCKTIGVAGTYAVNAASKQPELVAKFLDIMTRPEMGKLWMEKTKVSTGVKVDTSGGFSGEYAGYFAELAERSQGREFFLGTPIDFIKGQCKETFIQVLNAAFPAGLMDASEAIETMDAACYNG